MKGGRIAYFAYAFVMLGMVLGAFPACQRRPLEDPDFFTKVKVKVNVNAISNVTCDVYNDKLPVQNIEPTAMHVLFYDINDNSVAAESYITNVSSEVDGSRSLSGDIAILPGNYKMLVYDFGTESTIVRNYSNFYSAEAYTDLVESSIRSHFQAKAGESGMIVNQPDHLVVASSEEENIPWHNDVYTIFTEAKSVVESWYVQIKVDGAEYISGAQAVLSGMVGSNHIATDSRQNEPQVSVWFELKKSDDKGVPVICTVFNTFGRVPDATNKLDITFDIKTVDGKIVQKTYDISELFLSEDAVRHHWLLINETIKIDPPSSTGGGSFDPKVEDWDNVETEIEL